MTKGRVQHLTQARIQPPKALCWRQVKALAVQQSVGNCGRNASSEPGKASFAPQKVIRHSNWSNKYVEFSKQGVVELSCFKEYTYVQKCNIFVALSCCLGVCVCVFVCVTLGVTGIFSDVLL